jgi:murein L,D-transpeptidase YafK
MIRPVIILLLFLVATTAIADEQPKAAKIMVYKSERKMVLLDTKSKVLRAYKIALGDKPKGPKTQEGDEKTPEGIYTISGRNQASRYHLSLRISYPNARDVAQAKSRGVSPGGDIMIHGLPNGQGWIGAAHLAHDWTDGCIAVTNMEIEEIWNMVPDGTPIEIRP